MRHAGFLARAAAGALLVMMGPAPDSPGRDALPSFATARAEEGWAAEFDAVCSRTQEAMTLSNDELRALVDRCDKLAPRLAQLDESRRKVYGKRLQQCRDLYDFVLKSRARG